VKQSRARTLGRHAYDVAIMGAGMAGATLAAILARAGKSVLLLDAGEHPRFAVGESTVGQTSAMLEVLAERFDVPELAHIAGFTRVNRHVSSQCGIKRGFGFVHHEEGRQFRADATNQLVIAPLLHGPESHLFRQDVDAYLTNVAVRHGAELRMRTRVESVCFDDAGVDLSLNTGESLRVRYLADAGGPGSYLARELGLRGDVSQMWTHSASLYTHMVGVRPFEATLSRAERAEAPIPWSSCTLHHLFDGGWLWVIPFDNHEAATNPLCSVGLTYDPQRARLGEGGPEALFKRWLSRYPAVQRQFEDARAARPWVHVPRLQYWSTRTQGKRFCLLSHSAGFIDPLFSRGLANTFTVLHVLGARLIEALGQDQFEEAGFADLEALQQGLIRCNDELVHGAYVSFRDRELWNAWYRVWVIGEAALDQLRILGARFAFEESRDVRVFDTMERVPHPGLLCPDHEGYFRLWNESHALLVRVAAGDMSTQEAAREIFARLSAATLVAPGLGLTDASRHHFDGRSVGRTLEAYLWGRTAAPLWLRERYAKLPVGRMLKMAVSNVLASSFQ
jgi:tetracycline 7-halogenase / FADH2 O2-dependent halogenase